MRICVYIFISIYLSTYLQKGIYFKELAHIMSVGTGKSEIHKAGQHAGDSD